MSGTPPGEILRDRLKAFLLFSKNKLLSDGADLDRLAQLRRLSDVRIRQFSVGKAQVTAADLAGFLSDPNSGRFDALADEGGLLRSGHFALPLPSLGEEMGYVVEVALTLQTVGTEKMRTLLKEFVSKNGRVRETAGDAAAAAPAPAAPKPLPPGVAKLLGGVRELWAVPAGTLKILELLQAPDRPPDAACAEIEKHPALASLCLRLVNTQSFAVGSRMTSVKRAVVTMGYPAMRRIVSISSLVSLLGTPSAESGFDLRAFWDHSLRVAHAAALFSRAAKAGNADDHFSWGIVHDLGRLVQARLLPSTLKPPGEPAGATHAEIGACVLERWGFPPAAVEAARHHRDGPERFEEIQVPREAIVVAAMCRLARDEGAIDAWSGLLRMPPPRIKEVRFEAIKLAEGSLKETFLPA